MIDTYMYLEYLIKFFYYREGMRYKFPGSYRKFLTIRLTSCEKLIQRFSTPFYQLDIVEDILKHPAHSLLPELDGQGKVLVVVLRGLVDLQVHRRARDTQNLQQLGQADHAHVQVESVCCRCAGLVVIRCEFAHFSPLFSMR